MKISVTNLKGGVGKSTITQNLAVVLAERYKVCIVDTDTNQSSVRWYSARDEAIEKLNVVSVIEPKALNKIVNNLHSDNDIILIDGTPSIHEMTTRIILASDILLIPIRPGAHDLRSMDEFLERHRQANEFRYSLGHEKDIPTYFILNEYDGDRLLHKDIHKILRQYGIPIFETTIKSRVAYGEASVEGIGVYEHSDFKAQMEMISLTKELLDKAEKHGLLVSS